MNQHIQELARKLATAYSCLEHVRAVALGGSHASGMAPDAISDLDLYVYRDGELSMSGRRRIASDHSTEIEVGNTYWEDGDEWIAREPTVRVDVTFRHVPWIEGELERVLGRHEPRLGYSTCILYSIQNCVMLHDRSVLAAIPLGGAEAVGEVTRLLDSLDSWLRTLGLLPAFPVR